MSTEVGRVTLAASGTHSALATIRRHGAAAFPDECCGALIAVEGVIVDAIELPNSTSAGAARRFRVSPADYRFAEAAASAAGGTLAGFYHSHPNHPARPSQHDLEQAWPNFLYVILSVVNGEPSDITSWRLLDDRSQFEEGGLRWDIA